MKCLNCNVDMNLVQKTLAIARRHLGTVSLPAREWHECPKCGERLYPDATAAAIDQAFQEKLAALLFARPLTELVEEKEVAEILGVSVQAVNKNKSIRGGLIWKAVRNGKTWYLRQSVEQFKQTGDGRFSLVRNSKVKRHDNVLDMVKDIAPKEKAFHASLARSIAETSLSRTLMLMRNHAGLSQADLGQKIGCQPDLVAKIEHSGNAAITVGEMLAYAKALNLNLSIAFHPSMNAVQAMDFHAGEIEKHMTQLAALAHQDKAIEHGIRDHFKKFGGRMSDILSGCCKKLPARKQEEPKPVPAFEISAPLDAAKKKDAVPA